MRSHLLLVTGHWPLVTGHWPLVTGHWPLVTNMGVPLRMKTALAGYLIKQKILGKKKYPLVLMLEPLFACNLKCAGCGKVQQPVEILKKRMTPEECWNAVEECGAPIVSIAGGEPLAHLQIEEIVKGFIKRKKFVFLCTNAVMLEYNLHKFEPSPYLIISVHLDGLKETHDRITGKGVYDSAVKAIKAAKAKGFCVMTNTTVYDGEKVEDFRKFVEMMKEMGIDGMMISPGYAYEKASRQDLFLAKEKTREWFRKAVEGWREKQWPLNQSPLFIDFLQGKIDFDCTAWGNPSRNIFGWQKPCYLIEDGGYAKTYKELIETTDWKKYGPESGDPRCANCMAHVGFEPSAVDFIFKHPLKALLRKSD